MLRLLQENLATVLVGLAMLLLIGLALWGALAPRRRAKRGGCGGGCCGCPSAAAARPPGAAAAPRRPSGSGRRPGHDRHACKAARNPLQ